MTTNLNNVNTRLMIARLHIGQWYPRKYDKKASQAIAQQHGIEDFEAVGRYNKILIDLKSIKPLQKRFSKLYRDHCQMTRPWADKGERVLPVELYFDYTEMVRDAAADIETLANDFVFNEYDKQREQARQRLNGLFREDDYPPAKRVRERFYVHRTLESLPNPEDVRVWGIGEQAAQQIEADMRANMDAAIKQAQADIVNDVAARANEFIDKITTYNTKKAAGEKTALFDSAIQNVRDICGLVLRGLNITNDQALAKLASELDSKLDGLTTKEIKESPLAGVNAIADVEKTLAKFAGVFGAA